MVSFSLVGDFVSQRYKKIIHIKYLISSQSFAVEKIMINSLNHHFSRKISCDESEHYLPGAI